MSLDDVVKSLIKDFSKEDVPFEKLNQMLNKIDQGHAFVKRWVRDRRNFQKLKMNPVFHGHIADSARGWFGSHDFPITLEILNKELTPGGEVRLHSAGGEKKDLLVYHALCPELENFVSLIVWVDSQSSMRVWKHISDLINEQDELKVLQFSQKCGIVLPNKIHPSHDQDSSLVTKDLYESLYDWRFAHYLFDDGRTIMSHNSPLNFRRVVLDEWDQKDLVVGIRTTIGRLNSIQHNSLNVSVPSIYGPPRILDFYKSDSLKDETLHKNSLYFFQIFKIVGPENIETHVRVISEATPVDIMGMFLAHSIYLLHLGMMRLKIFTAKQFQKLFNLYYDQVAKFCSRNNDELDTMNHLDWKTLGFGFTSSFTKWINSDLYVVPPLVRRFLSQFDTEIKEIIIQNFDKSLAKKTHSCFTEIPYDSHGNKMFTRLGMAKINKTYDYMNFIINEKRFILGIEQNPFQLHQRDEEIGWLKNKI